MTHPLLLAPTLRRALTRGAGLALMVTLMVALTGCDNPDPEGVFDDFVDRRSSNQGDAGVAPDVDGQLVDFSGQFIVALQAPIPGTSPIMLLATVEVIEETTINFNFQPLKTDNIVGGGPRDDARTPVGDPIVVNDVTFNEDGTFVADFGSVQVPGDANPISGGDITAELVMNGTVGSATAFCGTIDGQATAPSALDLTGTTFGAVGVAADADLTTITIENQCTAIVNPNNNNADAGTDGGDNDGGDGGTIEPLGRCPAGMAGDYNVVFETESSTEPTNIGINITESGDPNTCYTGEVVSKTDGSTLGEVSGLYDAENVLSMVVSNFTIPPGANPLLPNGGTANISLTAENWNSVTGACGAISFELFEPFPTTSNGTFTMVREGDPNVTNPGPTCADIVRGTPCGLEDKAGRWNLQFETESSTAPSIVFLELEADALSCVRGTVLSSSDPDVVLAPIPGIFPADGGGASLSFLSFIIPPGANPLLPNGGKADVSLTATDVQADTFCGELTFSLFDPFPTTSNGTFAAGRVDGNEPAGPSCETAK